jgi:hypothetical protein
MAVRTSEFLICFYMAAVACCSVYFATQLDKVPNKPICQLAEISPDFNPADRARCRQLRGHKL